MFADDSMVTHQMEWCVVAETVRIEMQDQCWVVPQTMASSAFSTCWIQLAISLA